MSKNASSWICAVALFALSLPSVAQEEPKRRSKTGKASSARATALGKNRQSQQAGWLGIEYRFWMVGLDGNVRGDKAAVPGTDVRLIADLDVEQNQNVNDITGWVEIPRIGKFRAGWWSASFAGTQQLTSTLRFLGSTYTAGSQVESEVSVDVLTVTYEIPLWESTLHRRGMDLDLELGGKYLSASAELRSPSVQEQGEVQAPLPIVGVRAEVGIWKFVRGAVGLQGLWYQDADRRLRLVDTAVELAARPTERFSAGLGYHLIDLLAREEDASDEESLTDLSLGGLYFTVGWTF